MKNDLINKITEVVVEHENKIQNCNKLEENLVNYILDALLKNYPEVMEPIINSNKMIKVSSKIYYDDYADIYRQNVIDNKYISIPRLVYCTTNKNNDSFTVSLKDYLKLNIKGLLKTILIRNYSVVKSLDFAEYSVQRINDYDFYKNISNMVYLKRTLESPYIDKLFSLGTDISGATFLREIKTAYKLATSRDLNNEFLKNNIYTNIDSLLTDVVRDNTTILKESTIKTERKIFKLIEKYINLNRAANGLERINIETKSIRNYARVLDKIINEMEEMKNLKTYYSNGFEELEDEYKGNGFYYDNGEFLYIDSIEDSLIECVKRNIIYQKLPTKKYGAFITVNPFNDYGFGSTLYNHLPFTTLIYNFCYDFLCEGKIVLADLTIEQFRGPTKKYK